MRLLSASRRVKLGVLATVVIAVVAWASWTPLLIRYRISRAKSELKLRNGDKAISWLCANQKAAPDNAVTQFLLARAYRRLGKMDEVRLHLERARKLGFSKQLIKREQWLFYAQSGQMKQADPHLSALLQDPNGDGREICEAYVAGYLLNHNSTRALQLLDAWQKDYPQDDYPYLIRGRIMNSAGNRKQAAESFRKCLKLNPKQSSARYRLASLLMEQHQHDEAGEHYQQCVDEQPENAEFLTGWSHWLQVKGRPIEARDALDRALKASPEFREARLAKGQLELSANRPKEALKWLEPLAEEFPYDRSIRYALARALQRSGKTTAAARHFDYAQKAGDASTQIQLLVEDLQKDKNNPEIRFRIGKTMLEYGNPAEAAIWLRSVLEIDQRHQKTHELLAAYYEKHGPAELAKHHRQAIDKPKRFTD